MFLAPRPRPLLAAFIALALLWLGAVRAVGAESANQPALSKCTPAEWAFVAADSSATQPWTGALSRPTPTPAPIVRLALGRPPIDLAAIAHAESRASVRARRPQLVGIVELRI